VALGLLPISGCVQRTHEVHHIQQSSVPLQEATLNQLVQSIDAEAAKVKAMNATVDIATQVGGEKKGKLTEYTEIRGYVLVRKPAMLRMIGLFPVVRNTAFDMVSDGEHFKLSVPPRNKFIVGSKDVVRPSKNALENLRPQHILDALLLREIDPKTEIAVLESSTETVQDQKSKKDVQQPNYVVNVIHHDEDGQWRLSRKIFFNREDLVVHRQMIYDKFGNIATIANYSNFSPQDGIDFPNIIQIERPQEEYSIQLSMVKLKLNDALRDDQFVLNQPPGSKLINIDQQALAETTKQAGGASPQ